MMQRLIFLAAVLILLFSLTYFARADQKALDGSLLVAVKRNDRHSVIALLRRGANPNARDNNGYSALARAAGKGFTNVAYRLMRAGAHPNAVDGTGGTPLMEAAEKWQYGAVRLLIRHGARVNRANANGFTPLMAAAIGGDARIVRYLIQHGANVNARMDGGVQMKDGTYKDTPITLARHWGHDEVEQLLRRAGAKE